MRYYFSFLEHNSFNKNSLQTGTKVINITNVSYGNGKNVSINLSCIFHFRDFSAVMSLGTSALCHRDLSVTAVRTNFFLSLNNLYSPWIYGYVRVKVCLHIRNYRTGNIRQHFNQTKVLRRDLSKKLMIWRNIKMDKMVETSNPLSICINKRRESLSAYLSFT